MIAWGILKDFELLALFTGENGVDWVALSIAATNRDLEKEVNEEVQVSIVISF